MCIEAPRLRRSKAIQDIASLTESLQYIGRTKDTAMKDWMINSPGGTQNGNGRWIKARPERRAQRTMIAGTRM